MRRMIAITAPSMGALIVAVPAASAMNSVILHNEIDGELAGMPVNSPISVPQW